MKHTLMEWVVTIGGLAIGFTIAFWLSVQAREHSAVAFLLALGTIFLFIKLVTDK